MPDRTFRLEARVRALGPPAELESSATSPCVHLPCPTAYAQAGNRAHDCKVTRAFATVPFALQALILFAHSGAYVRAKPLTRKSPLVVFLAGARGVII